MHYLRIEFKIAGFTKQNPSLPKPLRFMETAQHWAAETVEETIEAAYQIKQEISDRNFQIENQPAEIKILKDGNLDFNRPRFQHDTQVRIIHTLLDREHLFGRSGWLCVFGGMSIPEVVPWTVDEALQMESEYWNKVNHNHAIKEAEMRKLHKLDTDAITAIYGLDKAE